jgi:transcriptional regulator with XRE-family HTH domain
MSIIGENIKKLRTEKGYSMNELANLSGKGVSTISQIESGKRKNLSGETISAIAAALETTPDGLMSVADGVHEVTDLLDIIKYILEDEEVSINDVTMTKEEKNQFCFAAEVAMNTIIANRK